MRLNVAERMLEIQKVFQTSQSFASNNDEKAIQEYLEESNSPYISVAHEGVACALAEKDIVDNQSFKAWRNFLENNQLHSTQIHIGLGWALALKKKPVDFKFTLQNKLMYARVLDGYGYVDGLFRKRISITQKEQPIKLSADKKMGYNQGLGRSLWYATKGNVYALNKLVNDFPENRKGDLWRGIGIALGYVGGAEMNELEQLSILSMNHLSSLKVGVALSIYSRYKADTILPESNEIAEALLKETIVEVIHHFEKIEAKNYKSFIEQLSTLY